MFYARYATKKLSVPLTNNNNNNNEDLVKHMVISLSNCALQMGKNKNPNKSN